MNPTAAAVCIATAVIIAICEWLYVTVKKGRQ